MTITAILPTDRKGLWAVEIDGQIAFRCFGRQLPKYGLVAGAPISSDVLATAVKETEYPVYFNKVLSLLSRRPYSIFEIRSYLKKYHVGAETGKMVIANLEAKKFLDDRAFTQWFISQRQSFKKRGRRLLEAELKQKGIPSDIISTVWTEGDVGDESSLAKELLNKKIYRWKSLPPLKRKQKIYEFLARNGYSSEVISRVLKDESSFDDLDEKE